MTPKEKGYLKYSEGFLYFEINLNIIFLSCFCSVEGDI